MKALSVNETIKFQRGQNPYDSLGIGDKYKRREYEMKKVWGEIYKDLQNHITPSKLKKFELKEYRQEDYITFNFIDTNTEHHPNVSFYWYDGLPNDYIYVVECKIVTNDPYKEIDFLDFKQESTGVNSINELKMVFIKYMIKITES